LEEAYLGTPLPLSLRNKRMSEDKRVYLVVNHHGTVQVATLNSSYAFDRMEAMKKADRHERFEVKSYKLEGTE